MLTYKEEITDIQNNANFNLILSSNGKYLSVSALDTDTQEYFSENFSKNKLIQLDPSSIEIESINNIYQLLVNFIDTNSNNLSIIKDQDILTIKFQNIIKDNTLIFNLPQTNIEQRQINIVNNKITSVNKIQFHIPNENRNTIFRELSSHLRCNIKYVLFFKIFFSFILISSLTFVCIKYILSQNIFTKSNIVNKKDIKLISEWIDPSYYYNYTLLYRASRDGDSSKVFHDKCDNKGRTLTLVHTEDDWIFGGYTDLLWESGPKPDSWCYKTSKNTFIFSLNLKMKYPGDNGHAEILCVEKQGPTFGRGYDFFINDNCFMNKSQCVSPVSFGNMRQKNEFNGGQKDFIPKEVEVYLVEERKKK